MPGTYILLGRPAPHHPEVLPMETVHKLVHQRQLLPASTNGITGF